MKPKLLVEKGIETDNLNFLRGVLGIQEMKIVRGWEPRKKKAV